MRRDNAKDSRVKLINSITTPLGFFVLALLIVEAFLGAVLVGSNLEPQDKLTGMWTGVVLFAIVVGAVFYLVCCRPQNIVFDTVAHLERQKMAEERLRLVTATGLKDFAPEIQEAIQRELSSDEMVKKLSEADAAKLRNILKQVATKVTEDIKQSSFITVDLRSFGDKLGEVELPLGAIKDMDSLTDEVFVALKDAVKPWTYGNDWVLRDKNSKKVYRNLRMLMNAPRGKPLIDPRPMQEMGITAGMKLEAVKPNAK